MSALRYSGAIRIRLTLETSTSNVSGYVYRCSVVRIAGNDAPEAARGKAILRLRVYVGAPAALTESVDAPEAYDSAACAALAFANGEDSSVGDNAAFTPDLSGYHVGRSPAHAWPRKDTTVPQYPVKVTDGRTIAHIQAATRADACDDLRRGIASGWYPSDATIAYESETPEVRS